MEKKTNKTAMRKALGYEMRTQRLIRRRTLQDVADYMGKARTTISAYELGKIPMNLEDLQDYCDCLGINASELMQKAVDKCRA